MSHAAWVVLGLIVVVIVLIALAKSARKQEEEVCIDCPKTVPVVPEATVSAPKKARKSKKAAK